MSYAARALRPSVPFAWARDAQFAVALLLGPIAWLAASAWPGAHPPSAAILADPLRYASLVAVWPLLEEWLFRGTLQPAFQRTRWGMYTLCGISGANALTSALFAAAHGLSHAPMWAAAVFAPSLVFGYFRDRHDSMVPAAVLHIFYNAGWFMVVSA